jgi:hypothetical protein
MLRIENLIDKALYLELPPMRMKAAGAVPLSFSAPTPNACVLLADPAAYRTVLSWLIKIVSWKAKNSIPPKSSSILLFVADVADTKNRLSATRSLA